MTRAKHEPTPPKKQRVRAYATLAYIVSSVTHGWSRGWELTVLNEHVGEVVERSRGQVGAGADVKKSDGDLGEVGGDLDVSFVSPFDPQGNRHTKHEAKMERLLSIRRDLSLAGKDVRETVVVGSYGAADALSELRAGAALLEAGP